MTNRLLIRFNKYHYAVALLAGIVFAFGLNNQFNNWDDTVYVTENPSIALNKEHVTNSFFKGERHGMYLPLTALSFSMNYALSQLHPRPYLLTNLLIHLLNIFLVMSLLQKLFKKESLTLFAGALFALHPMQAESVSYVAGRRDTLYAVFYFLSLLSYLNYTLQKEKKWRLMMLGFFILSLLSKGQAIALPATLVLIDFIQRPDFSIKKSLKDKWLLIVLSLIFAAITLAVKQQSRGFNLGGQILHLTFFERLLFSCYGFMMYCVNLLVPYKLSLIHPYPDDLHFSTGMILALLFVLAYAWALFHFRKTQKNAVAGLWFFAINIFLVLQFIPNSYGIMNDHYVYVPAIGIFITLFVVLEKCTGQKIAQYAFGLLLVFSVVLLAKRIAVFKNNFTVFGDVIKTYPDSCVGYNNRGSAYYSSGNVNDAKKDFDESIRLCPDLPTAYSNRASILINQGQAAAAIDDLNKAIELNPQFASAYSNRGVARTLTGDNRGLEDLNKAIELNASDAMLYYNRAGYWMSRGQKEKACDDLSRAHALGLKGGNPALDKLCP